MAKLPASEYIARFSSYFLSRLLIYGLAAVLIILSFFAGLNYMNISVLLQDGMNKRAMVIIMGEDPSGLVKVFSKEFLDGDELLYSDAYKEYVIRGINHNTSTEFQLIFPWQDDVTVIMTESIPYIDGELPAELVTDATPPEVKKPPEWQDGKYEVRLKKLDGSWRIVQMKLIEKLAKPDILSRLSPSPSPSAKASPSPDNE